MELKEYINSIKKYKTLFLATIAAVVLLVFSYFYFRPIFYIASLTLNITRLGTQDTQAFRYDEFYRLQADEKFADTVVEWLKAPRIAADIYTDSGIDAKNFSLNKLAKSFSAERRSPQIVAVNFSASSSILANKLSASIVKIISQNIENLNKDQKENNWFKIISEDPVIIKFTPDYKIIILASLLAGVFLGFWVVMIKRYFS